MLNVVVVVHETRHYWHEEVRRKVISRCYCSNAVVISNTATLSGAIVPTCDDFSGLRW